jgi:hypothetical protein
MDFFVSAFSESRIQHALRSILRSGWASHAHKSSKCNASVSISATVGEEPEVELALV